MTSSLFLKACRHESVPRPPVWMMRQAGRYLPEYREVRSKVDFLTLCKTPELATKVTLQPIDILEVDAAVIFSDILVLLEAMGMKVTFEADHGPRIHNPIKEKADLDLLHTPDCARDLAYVGKAIQLTAAALKSRNIPVIGFAGAPFTLACYAIEGKTSREFNQTRKFMHEAPDTFASLLKKIGEAISLHLRCQIEAGASVVQIFDTWGGVLTKEAYRKFALPVIQKIVKDVKKTKTPIVLYVNGSTPHLETMAETGADVLSVDWRLPLSEVRKRVGMKVGLQGNLDPAVLYGSKESVVKATRQMLKGHPGKGWIANLGHGILPDIPVDNVRAFVQTIKG